MFMGIYNSINNYQTAYSENACIKTVVTNNTIVENFAGTDTTQALLVAEPATVKKQPRPLKTFELYPTTANKFIYIKITGKQTVTLHNAAGKLIFRTAIREKATVNLSPLPPGDYILTDEKTCATKNFSIVR